MTTFQIILIASGAAVFLLAIVLLGYFARRGNRKVVVARPQLKVDVERLPQGGPDPGKIELQFYGIPVRLAVLVIAPKGQSMELPNDEQFRILIDRITPGMGQVLTDHQPLIKKWPPQLSVEGFSHSFFNNVQLPGSEGRGTPWCGVVGTFTVGMGSLLIGLTCVAHDPNQSGQVVVKHEGQWRDVVRVQRNT